MMNSPNIIFIPAESEQAQKIYEKQINDVRIDMIADSEAENEYIATVLFRYGRQQKLLVKQWKNEIEGKNIWNFSLFEMDTRENVSRAIPFAGDSYYWTDQEGIHMHFGPVDKALIKGSEDDAVIYIAAIISKVCPSAGLYAKLFIELLSINIESVGQMNYDGQEKRDVFISWN